MNLLAIVMAGTMLVGGIAAAGTGLLEPHAHAGAPAAAPVPGAADLKGPSREDAMTRLERLEAIHIRSREAFNPENGVRSGSGSAEDPYVFSGFFAPRMTIEDVGASYILRDVYIAGTLRLDYTGATARIESSTIGFLLTDTNRPHTAPHTWLDVQGNSFGAVRIRHAGGTFADNVIGAPGQFDPDRLAFEVQGYNGLAIRGNIVHGPTEFRLHGHHYAQSHEAAWHPMMGADHGDPALRYHEVRVTGNTFHDASGRGVAISDRDHAANHATAKSSPDERLNGPHRHDLRFWFEKNHLRGAGIVVEKPNASDPKHTSGAAMIHVAHNTVIDPLLGIGIEVRGARGSEIHLEGNVIENTAGRLAGSTGILLRGIEGGAIEVRGGRIAGFEHGVRAREVSANTTWAVEGVTYADASRDLYWDRTVKAAPRGHQAKSAPAGHDHGRHG